MQYKFFLIILSVLFPTAVFAHGSHGTGIMAGFTHPIFGLDHAITIFGIGFLAYLKNKSEWYILFVPFLVAMIVGGYLGIEKEATFTIEKFIALSVLLTGFGILLSEKLPKAVLSIVFASFGFFHGFAHGAEMPQMNSLVYISGFVLGTLLVASTGMLIARMIDKAENKITQRTFLFGGIIIGCGLIILAG